MKYLLLFSLLLITIFGSGVFLLSKDNDNNITASSTISPNSISLEPDFYDLENIPINGGDKTLEYKIKNISSDTIILRRFSTSCMCTSAKVTVGDKTSKEYSMESPGDKNAPVNIEISPGQSALVTVTFDPAAHGPKGIGSFERTIYLYFSGSTGQAKLRFKGNVIGS